MKPKWFYLALMLAGVVLPYSQFIPWVFAHGLDMRLFVSELFANRISAFFGMDVLVSAVVLFRLVSIENRRLAIPMWWLPLLATLVVGVSCGLPLFLYLRELKLERA